MKTFWRTVCVPDPVGRVTVASARSRPAVEAELTISAARTVSPAAGAAVFNAYVCNLAGERGGAWGTASTA